MSVILLCPRLSQSGFVSLTDTLPYCRSLWRDWRSVDTVSLFFFYIYIYICGPSVCRSCSVIPHIFFGRNCFICLCWFRVSVGEDRFRGFLWCNLRPAFEANFFFLIIALNSLTNLQWEIIFQRKTHKQVDLTAQYICLLLKLPCGSISCNINSKEFILWIPVSLIFPCHQEALVY